MSAAAAVEELAPAAGESQSAVDVIAGVMLKLSAGQEDCLWDEELFLSGYAELLGVERGCMSMTRVSAE